MRSRTASSITVMRRRQSARAARGARRPRAWRWRVTWPPCCTGRRAAACARRDAADLLDRRPEQEEEHAGDGISMFAVFRLHLQRAESIRTFTYTCLPVARINPAASLHFVFLPGARLPHRRPKAAPRSSSTRRGHPRYSARGRHPRCAVARLREST